MLHSSHVREEWAHVRGTMLQTPRSVQKEEKVLLQLLELTLPCSPWWRPWWWGSSAPAAHGGPQGREDPPYSKWRTPCQSKWMCSGEIWNCWRATLQQEKSRRRKEWHTGGAVGWSHPTIPHSPALLSLRRRSNSQEWRRKFEPGKKEDWNGGDWFTFVSE